MPPLVDTKSRVNASRKHSGVEELSLQELQAYPWIRNCFKESFKQNNIVGWIAAQKQLYEYLSWVIQEVSEKLKNHEELTLDDLVLLYHAVSHGCKAGQSEEILKNLYNKEIFPAYGKDLYTHFSSNNIEAIVDLGIISSFFLSPWELSSKVGDERMKKVAYS